MSGQFEGSCLCSAVRFLATGQPESIAWCHCESCRKHSGAHVSVFVAFKRDAYVVTDGQITKFNSSPGRWRGFCARCGSTLTCEGERSNETHFHVGAFCDAAQLQPTRHIFPKERLRLCCLSSCVPIAEPSVSRVRSACDGRNRHQRWSCRCRECVPPRNLPASERPWAGHHCLPSTGQSGQAP
jgi:hypothetical protein